MQKFDTKVQYLKYRVLKELAGYAWEDCLLENVTAIPKTIVPGPKPTMRCCIYKEQAILTERVQKGMNQGYGDRIIEVIDIACDECPVGGYEITNSCRGCLAHRCIDACRFDAIQLDHNYVAHIDKSKCVECGLCAKNCPYMAIIKRTRPCELACKINAISMDDNKAAKIDYDKCTACGACVYQCPFGAITDKSYLLEVIKLIKGKWTGHPVFALLAPAISTQFTYAKLGQVVTGLKVLGFDQVIEAALGADMVAQDESLELKEKGFLMSSCCPAFVSYVQTAFPDMADNISHSLSPMATVAKFIKERRPDARIVFIGPCTAKKEEVRLEHVKDYVDSALTFEELQALFDSRDIDITTLEESTLDDATGFGRGFAKCGGLAEAVAQALKENGGEDFELKALSCDGLEECRTALLRKSKNALDVNFIEGMACVGGCIGGAGCLTHGPAGKKMVERHSKEAATKTISEAVEKSHKRKPKK